MSNELREAEMRQTIRRYRSDAMKYRWLRDHAAESWYGDELLSAFDDLDGALERDGRWKGETQ